MLKGNFVRPCRFIAAAIAFSSLMAILMVPPIARAQEQPDFLSPGEADKVREAPDPDHRIRLFLDFAQDRLKKLQYELQLTTPQVDKPEILNGLLSGYSGCLDETADRIQEAQQKGAKIRSAIKDAQKRGKAYLETLKTMEAANGPGLVSYKDSLDDAISATQGALNAAAKASKEYGSLPIRRKP